MKCELIRDCSLVPWWPLNSHPQLRMGASVSLLPAKVVAWSRREARFGGGGSSFVSPANHFLCSITECGFCRWVPFCLVSQVQPITASFQKARRLFSLPLRAGKGLEVRLIVWWTKVVAFLKACGTQDPLPSVPFRCHKTVLDHILSWLTPSTRDMCK